MTLVLALLIAFPGPRIANLPTGMLPESHVWQFEISHRFLPAACASGWKSDVLQLFLTPVVREGLDKSLGEKVTVGCALDVISHEAALHAAYAPLACLTIYPEISTGIRSLTLDATWLNVGICAHRAFGDRVAVMAQPRYTTNTKQHFLSLGLGGKVQVLPSWSLGLEVEPVLAGRDSTTDLAPWAFTIEKEYGGHNFIFTLGSALYQSAPAMFRSERTGSGYDPVLDITKGEFRIGFNILRRI